MWNGQGLPPVAAERASRAAAGGAWTSLLSAPAMAGLEVAGFDPVGEVMGSMVEHIDWHGNRCVPTYGRKARSETITSSYPKRDAGYRPYVEALETGYRTALARMVLEASTLGADGIVGVGLSKTDVGRTTHEFTAIGTAVRARSSTRPRRVFATHLSGQDVAKLLAAGWTPTNLVFGISVGIRHDDRATLRQRSWLAGNVEVTGYTELVSRTRDDARQRLAGQVRRAGADGAIVSSMDLKTTELRHSSDHIDHIAEFTIFGTALASVDPSTTAPIRPLAYLPLR